MNITDELRACIKKWGRFLGSDDGKAELLTIADRIDAEYQKAEDEWKAKGGQSWLHGYEECHLELMEGNEAIAANLEEAGWVKLPLDADGVPIHIGDRMEPNGSNLLFGQASFEARAMRCGEGGWEVYDRLGDRYAPSLLRHHREPTVEDVLWEFALEIDPSADIAVTGAETIKKFAAKLQLKGIE